MASNDAMDHLAYRRPGRPKTKDAKEKMAEWHLAQALAGGQNDIKNAAMAYEHKVRQDRRRLGLE